MNKPLEEHELNDSLDEERAQNIVARIPAKHGVTLESAERQDHSWDAKMLKGEARAGTRRIQSQRNDREDISEVEYRQIRLERVAPVGSRTTQSKEEVDTSLRELAALTETAGSRVPDAVVRKRAKPDPVTYLGSDKAKELTGIVRSVEVDTVIVSEELTPSRCRGLEDVIGAKVVDRAALILDIFTQHAKPREGRAQVELAQLEYLLPRLRG